MQFVNLTPHAVTIYRHVAVVHHGPRTGEVLRGEPSEALTRACRDGAQYAVCGTAQDGTPTVILAERPTELLVRVENQVAWTIPASGSVARVATPAQDFAGRVEFCELRAEEAQCSGDFVPADKLRAYSSVPGSQLRYAVVPLASPPDFTAGTVTGIPQWLIDHEWDESGYPYALIVGQIGAEAVARMFPRRTILATDTGPQSAVRDSKGNILGVRRLILVQRGE